MMSRLACVSVICVTGHVASPAMVHSNRTAESTWPQLKASMRVSPGVDSARILAWSWVPTDFRSPYHLAGNWRFTSTLRAFDSDTSALWGIPSDSLDGSVHQLNS